MKVVHIGFKYGNRGTGGAAVAATRLHLALLASGVESHYVCIWRCQDGPNVYQLPTGWRRRLFLILTRLIRCFWVLTPYRKPIPMDIVPMFGLKSLLLRIQPDVIHVHWISADVMSFEQLGRLKDYVPKAKVVLNLHDLYFLNAFAPHSRDGECRYKDGFNKNNSRRLERWVHNRKRIAISKLAVKAIEGNGLCFLGPSEWTGKLCRESIVGRDIPFYSVSNLIDKNFEFDESLLVRREKFTILFGAYQGRSNIYKGWEDLVASLRKYSERYPDMARNTEVVVFGESSEPIMIGLVAVRFVGVVSNPKDLARLYHEGDMLAFPSTRETQGMAKIEALCCGLPVVAFDRSACAEGIIHGESGWISPDGNISEYVNGIIWAFRLWASSEWHQSRRAIARMYRQKFGEDELVGQIKVIYSKKG